MISITVHSSLTSFLWLSGRVGKALLAACVAEVAFTLYAKGSDYELFSYNIPNVSLKQNYRTNIYGSVLTTNGTFTIAISPDYSDEIVVAP